MLLSIIFLATEGIVKDAGSRTPLNYLTTVLVSEEVPAYWNLAIAIPVCKKGVRKDTGSYRPVSLSSDPGKVMQTILYAIERHLKNSGVIKHTQHGFTRGMFHLQ